MGLESTLFGKSFKHDMNVWDSAKVVGSTFSDAAGLIPALGRTILHGNTSYIDNDADSLAGMVTGSSQAFKDIYNPPSATTIQQRKVNKYNISNVAAHQ